MVIVIQLVAVIVGHMIYLFVFVSIFDYYNQFSNFVLFFSATNCPNKLNVQPPLSIRKISNHSSVVDLHCQLGYRLQLTNKKINGKKINFFDSIDHGSSSSLSYPTLSSSSIRAYCIGKQWFIDDPDQPDHSFTTTMIPLDQWPTCESKHIFSIQSLSNFRIDYISIKFMKNLWKNQ